MSTELRTGTPQEAGMNPARVERVKELARGWVEEGVHPALVVLAARRGVIFLHEAFGRLRPGEDTPLPRDAIFPIASATKPATAACVLLLVEEGKVGLMRPVREYFPEISAEGSGEVLVHHLLCHLSGWRDIDVANEALKRSREVEELPPPEPGQHRDIANLLYLTRATPLACRPGEAMQYCGHGFELLAELVRRVSGLSIEQFARERLFEPLGMDDSSYVLPPEHRARKVRRAEGMPGTEFRSRFEAGVDSERSEGQPWGGRGMHTSAGDYAVFAQMLLNNGTYGGLRILSRASVEAMRRNHIPAGVPVRSGLMTPDGQQIHLADSYGYGLFPFGETVTPSFNGGLASPASFSHSGAGGIYWWADPERELIGIYLSVAAILAGTISDWRADLFVDAVTAAVED